MVYTVNFTPLQSTHQQPDTAERQANAKGKEYLHSVYRSVFSF